MADFTEEHMTQFAQWLLEIVSLTNRTLGTDEDPTRYMDGPIALVDAFRSNITVTDYVDNMDIN